MKSGKKEKVGKIKKKILAVSSGGGHWVQLLRLRPAFEGHEVVYVTTIKGYKKQVNNSKFYFIIDANRWNKLKLILLSLELFFIVFKEKPDVVISTGAAPGFFALMFGKLFNSKTIWLDSIANANELSLSGKKVQKYADLWLTQWPNLSTDKGPFYKGSVI